MIKCIEDMTKWKKPCPDYKDGYCMLKNPLIGKMNKKENDEVEIEFRTIADKGSNT